MKINNSNDILYLYVILQYYYKVDTIIKLYKNNFWDYNLWKIIISTIKENNKLPDHFILLNCFLNLKEDYNKPIEISKLEKEYKLIIKDKRGLGGERPRELNYKYGFPYFTSSTNKILKNSQRIFICPFPIEKINPKRKALVDINTKINKCFTCGCIEGDTDIFGNICNFEKGHLIPININNTSKALMQCKWCNTFYKDKIIWNIEKGKPEFNAYAIIRDLKKTELIKILKQLNIKSTDLD